MNTAYTDRQRLMLGDANQYVWRVGVSANDGGGDGVVTVTSGSTTTVINGTNTAVIGQTLYVPSTGEERLITGATGSQITVAALSAAPTAGMEVYVGSIRQRIMTDWNPGGGINAKKRPTKFLMAVRPETDMGTGTVSYYQDFSATAVNATSFAADTFPEGISIANGDISIDFDDGGTDGLIPVPTPCDWKRVIRAEIIAETPLDGVRFLDASFRDDSTMDGDEE
jgi:hypothetical protein